MKTSIAVLALFGLIDARHHHHHHTTLAQAEPKAVTPDSNRKVFDESVKAAAGTVDVQKKTENDYVTQITDIHKKATDETHTKNTVTKAGRQISI